MGAPKAAVLVPTKAAIEFEDDCYSRYNSEEAPECKHCLVSAKCKDAMEKVASMEQKKEPDQHLADGHVEEPAEAEGEDSVEEEQQSGSPEESENSEQEENSMAKKEAVKEPKVKKVKATKVEEDVKLPTSPGNPWRTGTGAWAVYEAVKELTDPFTFDEAFAKLQAFAKKNSVELGKAESRLRICLGALAGEHKMLEKTGRNAYAWKKTD